MKLSTHEDLWARVRDRIGLEAVHGPDLLDQFKHRDDVLHLSTPERAWEDGWQCGKSRVLAILQEEMAAWPKGSQAWQAIEAERRASTGPASQRPLPTEA